MINDVTQAKILTALRDLADALDPEAVSFDGISMLKLTVEMYQRGELKGAVENIIALVEGE